MRQRKRLTPAEFEAVRQLLNISENRIEAARQVLVEGKTMKSVGDQFGWTRQAVFDTVNIVWKTYERYLEAQLIADQEGKLLPHGWERVVLIAPSHMIDKFWKEISRAHPEAHIVSRVDKMRTKKRLTEAEFNAVLPLLKISENRIEAARQVLVEGRTFQSVGDQFGWTWQSVFDAVGVVWKTYERYLEAQRAEAEASMIIPHGWEQVTLIAPSHLIAKLREEIAQFATKEKHTDPGR